MFDTVLCCTDFSANSYSAFLQAARIAEEEGARLYVLHVVPPVPQVVRLGIRGKVAGQDELPREDRAADEQEMARRIKSIYGGATDAAFEAVVRHGPEVGEILRFAAQVRAQLIVLGARDIGALEALLAGGSVADGLVRKSWVPLLVVPA